MKEYLEIIKHVLDNGVEKTDRTGVGTISVVGASVRFDLTKGFPLVTTKDMTGIRWKGIVEELLWFLRGSTNNLELYEKKINIWNAWAKPDGSLGPIYGHQWRNFNSQNLDQVKQVLDQLSNSPDSRRMLVSAWNPAQIPDMALPPCHFAWQVVKADEEHLSMVLYMRSSDVFLGLPYNIASYSLLLEMICQVTGYKAKDLVYHAGDCHIYTNHLEQVKIQLEREPFDPPQLVLNPEVKDLFKFTADDIQLLNYKHHPALKGSVAV